MYIIWELPDKSIALTIVIGEQNVQSLINQIQTDRPEFTFKFTSDSLENSSIRPGLFFKAIELDESNNPVYNMSKARNFWRDKIRVDRYKKFKELDTEYIRAVETNDSVSIDEIVAQKQILRDAPADPRIEAATNLEELQQVYPDILK